MIGARRILHMLALHRGRGHSQLTVCSRWTLLFLIQILVARERTAYIHRPGCVVHSWWLAFVYDVDRMYGVKHREVKLDLINHDVLFAVDGRDGGREVREEERDRY